MKPVGIVTGLRLEARIARRGAAGARVACRGMGSKRAREAAEELVRAGAGGLVSFGMAGGLTEGARPGMVIVPAAVVTESGGMIATDTLWRERLNGLLRGRVRLLEGTLASVRRPLPGYLDKASAWARTQAVAADMESAAVAAVARRSGLPFVALRAISDPVDFNLPHAALAAMGKDGALKPWRLALSLWRQPRQLGPLRELAGHAAAAREALRRALGAAGPYLALQATPKSPKSRAGSSFSI